MPAYRAAEKPSNKRLIRNALRHVCLAGAANAPALRAAEAALDDVPPDVATIFVVLFRENVSPHKYRALYALRRDERGAGKVGEDSRRGGTVVRRAGDGGVHDEVRQRNEGVQTDGDVGGDAADGGGDVREAIGGRTRREPWQGRERSARVVMQNFVLDDDRARDEPDAKLPPDRAARASPRSRFASRALRLARWRDRRRCERERAPARLCSWRSWR